MHSIRTKIAFITALIVVITMAVATIFGVGAMREMGTNNARQTLLLLCETGEKNLDSYFKSVEQSVEMASTYVSSDLQGLSDEQLQEHLNNIDTFFDALMSKANGVRTYYYRINPAISENVKGFWYVRQADGIFAKHEVTDITQYDTSDTNQLKWYTVPKKTGESAWLSPYVTENLEERVISYNAPIYYEGTFVGVVGIEMDYSFMAEQVNNITLYNNGYAYINDSTGNIIYHPRIDVTTMEEQPKVPEGILSDDTFITYEYEGSKKLAVWLPLENGMRLNVCVPLDEISNSWRVWASEIILIFLAMLVIFVTLMLSFAGRITKPLRDLVEVAKEVDAGNYDVSLDYDRKDEVGTLAKTINQLVAHLKSHIGNLNDLAFADSLTSLHNRGAFNIYIEKIQAQINESEEKIDFAVCAFDCNGLKKINDNYGHDKGDLYLKAASSAICDVFEHSPVFRTGGDEFIAILQDDSYLKRDDLVRAFDKLCKERSEAAENEWDVVSIARGLAVYDPSVDASVDEVVRRADMLMYENKWKINGAK